MQETVSTSGAGDEPLLLAAVERFQRGADREQAFRVLFERFRRPVEHFFARRGVPSEDCRDLTQETFLGIYKGLESWRPEARLSTWVFKIATTTWLKRRRADAAAKRDAPEVPAEELGDSAALGTGGGQLRRVLDDERRHALRAAMAELPDKMRRCLALRVDQDLKYREIATVMQLSIETVKAHLFQARKRLGEKLSDLAVEEEP
jgi:RNA polymerase sigma-70 factor (ECF subfamily)